MNATGRYAPSPTGDLHLGNLRTALLAWLLARSQGAPFLLRIEDLDRDRSRPRYERRQLGDLRSLGLDWDGTPMRQSDRSGIYEEAVEQLRTEGLVYECFCTRAEIREAASAPHEELPEGAYPGTCLRLTATERAERAASGRPAALRVRAGGRRIAFDDRLRGPQQALVDDFVIRRNDGTHGYNLAVVVDDAAQEIGEVVRGRDLLSSTGRQILIAEALGLPPIESWVHVPLVVGDDGSRLAKRHGAITLEQRRAAGEEAERTLALLAASVGLCEPNERLGPSELLDRFDPDSIPTADGTIAAAAGSLHTDD